MLVSYTATSMALAIATGQSVVSVANLLSTVAFVFMIVSSTVQFSRMGHEPPEMLKSRNPTSMDFRWILQKVCWGQHILICLIWVSWCCGVEYSDLSFKGGWRVGGEKESGSSDFFSVALAERKLPGKWGSHLELHFILSPLTLWKANVSGREHDLQPPTLQDHCPSCPSQLQSPPRTC